MGSKPSVDNSALVWQQQQAADARAQEDARQARIGEGLKTIKAVFEGGQAAPIVGGGQTVTGVKPEDQAAYDAAMAAFQNSPSTTPAPVAGIAGLGGNNRNNEGTNYRGPDMGGMAGLNRMARRPVAPKPTTYSTPIQYGAPTTYEGMDPLLAQRRSAMEGFYLPQLDDQAQDAKDQLVYALSRAGLINSSTAGKRQGDLSRDLGLRRGEIMANIAGDLTNTRTRIGQQRSAIEAGLRSSGDASAAADQALQSAVTFRQDQPSLSVLGPLFASITQGIGTARNASEAERIRRLSTPPPISGSAGRVVGA